MVATLQWAPCRALHVHSPRTHPNWMYVSVLQVVSGASEGAGRCCASLPAFCIPAWAAHAMFFYRITACPVSFMPHLFQQPFRGTVTFQHTVCHATSLHTLVCAYASSSLHTALSEEPPGLRATVAEATSSLAAAFAAPRQTPAMSRELDELLLTSITSTRVGGGCWA
jgi:hypothetical protein